MIFKTPALGEEEREAIQAIEGLRRSLGYALQEPRRWTGFLRRNLIAKAMQGSNSIEGFVVTFEEAIGIVEGEPTETAEDTRLALDGYRKAMSYILAARRRQAPDAERRTHPRAALHDDFA